MSPEPPPAIEARDLSRGFDGLAALDGVDLTIEAGSVVAVLGPNGAGKTTLLRVLATLLRPDGGRAAVCGHDVVREAAAARRAVGLVAHRSLLYPDLTADENLRFYARLYGLPAARVDSVLAAAGLGARRHDPVRTLSHGLAQRLAIARAVLHEPAVLLLDEPYTGLDPRAAADLDATLSDLAVRGSTVLLTTHDLDRAAELADRVVVLHRGRLRWEGRAADLPPEALEAFGPTGPLSVGRFRAATRPAPAATGRMDAGGERAVAAASEASVFQRTVGAALAIAMKDVRNELRAREAIPPVAVFALVVLVVFHFALPPDPDLRRAVAPGALWIALMFGSTLGLARGLGTEVDSGAITALFLSPADRGAIFAGKWLSGTLFSLVVAGLVLPALVVLLGLPLEHLPALAAVFAAALPGWVAAGTLLGAMAVSTRAREVLLPVLVYPVVLPLVVAAVLAATRIVEGAGPADLAGPLALIGAYDIIYLVLGFLFFATVMEG